ITKSPPSPAQLCDVEGTDLGQVQSGATLSGTITFRNCGGQPLVWQQPAVDSLGLKLDKSNGTLAPNETKQLFFSATVPSLEPGPFFVPIPIIPNTGQQQEAMVKMTVAALPPKPAKLCNVTDVYLGQIQAGQEISGTIPLNNCGGLQLQWSAQSASGWGGI